LVAKIVSAWPSAQIHSALALVLILSTAAAAVGVRRLPRYRRRSAAIGLVSLMLTVAAGAYALRPLPSWTPPAGLRVTFLDVGQGDSTLLEAPGGAVLVDEGPPEADVAGQLRAMGVRALTAIVLTHPQRDHIGGASAVLDRLHVGEVEDPGIEAPSADHDAAVAAARRHRVPVEIVHQGDAFRIGRLRIRILWPDEPGPPSEDPNQHAVVILASYGTTDVLLTADAESDVTGRLRIPPAEVLKVAHHGSEDPGLPDLLRSLRPRLAVISVGQGNDYGHPRPETIAALRAFPGLETLRTDENGRIVVESDGRKITVRSAR
jgi:competence protein ComEC